MFAVAMVLAVRMAGTPRGRCGEAGGRRRCAMAGAGLYLTLSRGALAAAAVGVVVVVMLDPVRAQLRAVAVAVVTCLPAVAASELFSGVRGVGGSAGDGLAVVAILLVLSALGAVLAARWAGSGEAGPERRRLPVAAIPAALLLVVALGAAVVVSGAGREPPGVGSASDARADRLRSLGSNRGDYWEVALDVTAAHPLAGHGSGSFEVDWSRERTITEGVRDAHSLIIETAAELGVVGLVLLGMFLGGVAASVPRALRRDPVVAVGAVAALAAWLLHAQLDWLWEMPAASLNALLLAAAVLVLAEPVEESGQRHRGA